MDFHDHQLVKYDYYSPCSVSQSIMGRRKFRLGRAHKKYEQKRRATKKNPIGRPPKRRRCTSTQQPCSSGQPAASKPAEVVQVDHTPTTIENLRQAMVLPSRWTNHTQDTSSTIQVCKISSTSSLSSSQPMLVTHSLTVNNDFTWTAFVHGNHVDSKTSQALATIPEKLDLNSLNALLTRLDRCTVCPGHPDKHFVDMAISMKGKLTSRHGGDTVASLDTYTPVQLNGEVYTQTIRHSSCEIIVSGAIGSGAKCGHCVNYRNSLRKSFHRWNVKKILHQADELLHPVVQTLLCSTPQRRYNATGSLRPGLQLLKES